MNRLGKISLFSLVPTVSALLLGLSMGTCAHNTEIRPQDDGSNHIILKGSAAEIYKKLVGHTATTFDEKSIVIADENPSPYLICHEGIHIVQIKREKTKEQFHAAYIEEIIKKGYQKSKYELEAFERCKYEVGAPKTLRESPG